jgi:GGDEF domain-containing protein
VISASVGVAIYPDHGKDEAALVRQADDAMYVAKNYGGNQARTAGE